MLCEVLVFLTDLLGDESAPRARQSKVYVGKTGDPCTIQDLYLDECLLGVKLSEHARSVDELRQRLEAQLPQGSPTTRRLYSARICTWLYPSGRLDSPPLLAWRAYGDEQILLDHFRVRYLEAVPLMAKFVVGPLAATAVGESLSVETVHSFVARECGNAIPKTRERIPRNLSLLGFVRRNGKGFVRTVPLYEPTSVILELHRVCGQEPTTTPFAEIAAHPFWRLLGVPDMAALESALYRAVAAGLLAKFVRSDELNQITTGRSYRDMLASGARVPV